MFDDGVTPDDRLGEEARIDRQEKMPSDDAMINAILRNTTLYDDKMLRTMPREKLYQRYKQFNTAIAMSLSKHTQHYKGLDMPSIWTLTDEEAKQVEAGARTLIRMKDTDQDVIMMSLGKLQEENRLLRMSVDATGHEHKGKGPGGGQFVSKGGGGGGGGDPGKSDSKPNSKSESSKAQGNSQKTEPAPEGKPGGKQAESQAKPVTKGLS